LKEGFEHTVQQMEAREQHAHDDASNRSGSQSSESLDKGNQKIAKKDSILVAKGGDNPER
jgi:hypothetical protein